MSFGKNLQYFRKLSGKKSHTLYYIKKGTITFDVLEKVEVMNFTKL